METRFSRRSPGGRAVSALVVPLHGPQVQGDQLLNLVDPLVDGSENERDLKKNWAWHCLKFFKAFLLFKVSFSVILQIENCFFCLRLRFQG